MNDAQSTVAGLKAQDCPGGGWTGQPAELEQPTVADCLAYGVCGCIYGGAVQHIERLTAALGPLHYEAIWMLGQLKQHGQTPLKKTQAAIDAAGAALNHQQQVGSEKS